MNLDETEVKTNRLKWNQIRIKMALSGIRWNGID